MLALGAACARPAAPVLPAGAQAAARLPKQVLAFYYGWYGRPQAAGSWTHWSSVDEAARRIGSATHYPKLGPYDSRDPAVIDQHFRWAREAGVTGFIVSWWGPGDFTDRGMPLLLETARQRGLSITAYFEIVQPDTAPSPQRAADDLLYLLDRYGRDPAWLKVNGKPVVFIYSRAVGQITVEGWRVVMALVNERHAGGAAFIGDGISPQAAAVFDGLHTYNPTGRTAGKSIDEIAAWAHATFPRWIQIAGAGRIACVTILPGYDDAKLGRAPPRPITDRHGGETYRVLWQAAIDANPDWILICSWNEWHEGSEIEPSDEHQARELKTTAAFAKQFLARAPRVP